MRDFAFLYPQYYSSEKEWDDHRNLITASIFPLVKKSIFLKIKDDLEYLAESMIEYKPAVNHKIQFCNDAKVKQYYAEKNEQRMRFINYMLSLCENKEAVHLDENAFNHLTQ